MLLNTTSYNHNDGSVPVLSAKYRILELHARFLIGSRLAENMYNKQ
jgi:hypothetical protein